MLDVRRSISDAELSTLNSARRLTTNEKKRILLDNIYGVDIDSQAVDLTKLSLLLKVLEGEGPPSDSSGMAKQDSCQPADNIQ